MKTKACSECSFDVPRDAKVCGFCGARFVTVNDKTLKGRLFGAVAGGIVGGFLGAIVGGIFFDSFAGGATVGAIALVFWGLLFGANLHYSRLD